MSNLRVVHRHTNKSRWKEVVKGLIGAVMVALTVGIGLLFLVEAIEIAIQYFTK